MAFEGVTPILRVRSPPVSIDYYVKVLGFKLDYPWAYEMQIEDPDEHVLRFGSDSKANEPFGEWRDMRGDNWVMSPDGSWTRVE